MNRAALALPLAIAAIAFAPIFVRLALPTPPVVIGFYRMALAAGVLAVVLALRRHRVVWRGRAGRAALAAGAAFGTDLALWNHALAITPVAVATLLVNLTPIHVGIYGWLRGWPLDARFVCGAALAIAGCALLLGLPAVPVGTLGPALAVAASLFYATYLLCLAVARREIDVLSVFTLVTLASAGVLGFYGLALGLPFRGFSRESWAAMAGLALLSQMGGVFGVVWCMRYLSATFASVALIGQPALAAVLGWWLLAEPLSTFQLVGAAGVLAGIALAARSRGREPPAPRDRPLRARNVLAPPEDQAADARTSARSSPRTAYPAFEASRKVGSMHSIRPGPRTRDASHPSRAGGCGRFDG